MSDGRASNCWQDSLDSRPEIEKSRAMKKSNDTILNVAGALMISASVMEAFVLNYYGQTSFGIIVVVTTIGYVVTSCIAEH
jgi:hypothetical protein